MTCALEDRGDLLDEVCGHPYTYTWLQDALGALREERPGAFALALRLPSYLAAALVTGRDATPVRLSHEGGRIRLPALGELRLRGTADDGSAEVRAVEEGFLVTVDGGQSQLVRLDGRHGEGSGWRPVRTLGGDEVPLLRLDDIDPYRDCFGAPVHGRLDARGTALWDERLTEAWAVLADAAPQQAAEAGECLSTLTPLLSGEASLRAHGFGALGLALPETAGDWLSRCCAASAGRNCTRLWRSPISMHRTAGGAIPRPGRTRRSRCPSCSRARTRGWASPPSTPRGQIKPCAPSPPWRAHRSSR